MVFAKKTRNLSDQSPQHSNNSSRTLDVPIDSSFIETRILSFGSLSLALDVITDMDKAHQFLLSRRKYELKNWTDTDIFPHFGVIWPSALALATVLTQTLGKQKQDISCLELGCGLAIPSLLLKKTYGHFQMTATDRHPWVPKFLERNQKKNHIKISYYPLEWRAIDSKDSRTPWLTLKSYDLIIGSDLLYYPWQPRSLARTIAMLLKPGTGQAVIADPGRRFLDEFQSQAQSQGLTLSKVEEHHVPWSQSKIAITLMHLISN
jgi:2-polyprenyl-3-methyl-5-hydroxy-6-metoxy-1,4-benzoquinol methylase